LYFLKKPLVFFKGNLGIFYKASSSSEIFVDHIKLSKNFPMI